jgi:hypothetical protein
MRAKYIALLLIAAAIASVFMTVGSLLYRQVIRYEDEEVVRFGFPYYWVEHVQVTFVGRADCWNIETSNVAVNIALFFIVSLGMLSLPLVWNRRKASLKRPEVSERGKPRA